MAEDVDKLRATLAQLHSQIEELDGVDPEVRAMLHGAFYDIHHKLEEIEHSPAAAASDTPPAAEPASAPTPDAPASDSPQQEDDDSIPGRLNEAVQHFEETHPSLASNLGGLIDTLSQMGF